MARHRSWNRVITRPSLSSSRYFAGRIRRPFSSSFGVWVPRNTGHPPNPTQRSAVLHFAPLYSTLLHWILKFVRSVPAGVFGPHGICRGSLRADPTWTSIGANGGANRVLGVRHAREVTQGQLRRFRRRSGSGGAPHTMAGRQHGGAVSISYDDKATG